ncbi:hypothetical protein ACLOJK_010747 [Asimina triloba]
MSGKTDRERSVGDASVVLALTIIFLPYCISSSACRRDVVFSGHPLLLSTRKAASGMTPEPSCPMKLSISSVVVSDVLDRSICSFNGTYWVESRYALDVFAEMVETGVVDDLIAME